MIEELVGYPYEVMAPILSSTMHYLTYHSPELATQYLYLTEDYRAKLETAQHVAETWSREDPRTTLNWVISDQEVDDMRDQLLVVVMKEMTYVDPEQAFQVALGRSTGKTDIGLEAAVIEELAKIKFDRAMALLPRVRNSATMLSAATSVGRLAILNRKSSAIQDIALNLEESNRSNFYESLLPYWVSDDPKGLCDRLEELPSTKLRHSAAGSLYLKNEGGGGGTVLNDQQRRVVESFLTDEHRRRPSEFAKKIDDLRYVLP